MYIRTQVAREQRRLLAALARLDLEDQILGVVRVARREQFGQALLDQRQRVGERLGLDRECRVLGRELPGGFQIGPGLGQLAGRLVDRRQLREAPADLAGRVLVSVDRRVSEARLQLRILGEQIGEAAAFGFGGAHGSGSRL